MQSHLKRQGKPRCTAACRKCPGLRLAREQLVLLGPVKRQIEFGQTRRRELDGLPALEDGFDQLWAQEGNINEAPNVAPGDAIAVGQILERSGAASGQLLEPRATTRDRLDQRRITSQFLALLPQSGQQQLGSNATMPVIDVGRQFDRAGTWLV